MRDIIRGKVARWGTPAAGMGGEHDSDPASVEFCHTVGMDYLYCSSFRVPIARLAAAQAVMKEKK